MLNDMLDFWLGFLDGAVSILESEPIMYMFGLYIGFLALVFLRKLMHTKL